MQLDSKLIPLAGADKGINQPREYGDKLHKGILQPQLTTTRALHETYSINIHYTGTGSASHIFLERPFRLKRPFPVTSGAGSPP